ncbi:MAG: FapA family protein [Oxalobacteraceae bacterium]|nr:FapA family protein [Oxalobacteraceae bacterium]
MENPASVAPALSFILQQESGALAARYDPSNGGSRPDLALLIRLLGEQGFGDYLLPESALRDFIERCGNCAGTLEMPIGRRCDGAFTLTLDADLQRAHLTLDPPHGGQAVDPDAVLASVREQGIIHGLQQEALDAALAAGRCERLCIAKGDAALQGTPGRFESLLVDPAQQQADADADGSATLRYHDLCHLLLVRSGDPLMRRIAPIPGIDGTDIKGAQISASPVPEIAFAADLEGAAADPLDPDLLLATCAGQPVVLRNGVYINNVLEVPALNLSTGNIVFEGTIRIQGDVKSGMQLNVTGDVIVVGTVEAAEIIAGGNVAVNGGIIGHGGTQPGARALPANTARIRAQGTVQALFIEHAHIEAGDSIHVAGDARQSEMYARNAVLVGKPGVKNNNIAGGIVHATLLVRAPVLGSASGLETSVQVGSDPYLGQEIINQEHRLQGKLAELEQIRKLLAYLAQNPLKGEDGMGAKAQATFKQLTAEIYLLIEEKAELAAKQKLTEQARIEVSHTMHEGVELRIGKQVWSVHEDRAGGTVLLENGLIVCN